LKLCIDSIEKNTYYKDYEILIYSEGSTDSTNEWLEKKGMSSNQHMNCYIRNEHWNDKYHGIGGGLNFLSEQVTTPYIIFMHSDMYGGYHFDKALVDNVKDDLIISSTRMEPDIFLETRLAPESFFITRPGTITVSRDVFGHLHSNFNAKEFTKYSKDFIETNTFIPEHRKGEGAGGFIITKKTWDKIGGCDPLFAPASYEDMDLWIRAQLKGIEFKLTSKSLIWHFGSRGAIFSNDDFTKRSERQTKCENDNRIKWLTKWNKSPEFDNIGMVKVDEMKIINDKNEYR
jgi:GT2 family glycosyltransferase